MTSSWPYVGLKCETNDAAAAAAGTSQILFGVFSTNEEIAVQSAGDKWSSAILEMLLGWQRSIVVTLLKCLMKSEP